MIDEFRQLNEVEKRFLVSWKKYPERHLDLPCSQEEAEDILKYGFLPLVQQSQSGEHAPKSPELSNAIPEEIFIPADMDCGFLRHMRYMPAYWHTHEFFELLIVLSGSCISTFPSGDVTLQAGDICVQAPGTSHAVSAFSDEDIMMNILIRQSTFEHAFIGILDTDTIVSGFFRRAFSNTEAIPYLIFHTKGDPAVLNACSNAYYEFQSTHRYRRQMVNALLTELFLHLLQNHEKDLQAASVVLRDNSDGLMYILRYMQENYLTVTLHSLASLFNYSDRQMQRIIRKATGFTFTENIQKQKIRHAADLLQNTSLPIGIIAEKSGFDSPNNFRRTFRAIYNDTPQHFRKLH